MDKKLTVSKKEVRAILDGIFGGVFNSDDPKPLKIGIMRDLLDRAQEKQLPFTNNQLRATLRKYTLSGKYIHAMLKHTHRYDLDGNPVSEISEDDKRQARERINIRNEAAKKIKLHKLKQKEEKEARLKAKLEEQQNEKKSKAHKKNSKKTLMKTESGES